MQSELAIHISECLKEVDGIEIDWRVIKKYADDFEENYIECASCGELVRMNSEELINTTHVKCGMEIK